MHKVLYPTLLITSLGAALPAAAATEVGTIAAINPSERQVIYTDGETFTFPGGPVMEAVMSQYVPGEVVAVALDKAPDGSWSFGAIWPDDTAAGYAVP